MQMPKVKGSELYKYGVLDALHIWSIILAILGFAKHYLNRPNRFLRWANEAVYPFYILHQTIIVSFGFYIVQWPLPIWVKLPVLFIATVITLVALYSLLIRPFRLTRLLYGMKSGKVQKDRG
jgi:peptidoglycan/LPS O-acetylase OafA/YrhL